MKNKNFYPKTVACVIWIRGKVLLSQRKDTKTFSGYWESTGGKVEINESLTQAAIREIREETGLNIMHHELYIKDCIINDPTTEKCFLFEAILNHHIFSDVQNTESQKRSKWKLFTSDEALKLNLMPGLKEYFLTIPQN